MKRLLSAFVVLTLCAVGCGDDSGDDGNKGGSSNAGTDSGDAGESAAVGGMSVGGAPTGNNVACDPTEATTCQNETDCPFVQDGTARTTAQACGKGCLGSKEETCATDCILEKLDMTSECATCYADIVACTVMHCLTPCLADPEGEECATCQVDEGCRGTFNECSGLPE
jgi:hypothetical protein